jgi:hypothetical protein
LLLNGANIWQQNWLFASRKEKESIAQTHSHDDWVASQVHAQTDSSLKYMSDMKTRYIDLFALPDYRSRGLGWIDYRLDMMLTIVVAGNFLNDQVDKSNVSNITLGPGQVSIFIVDVVGKQKCKPLNSENTTRMDQPPLIMWVRATGPEIHAGTALSHVLLPQTAHEYEHQCTWRYDFDAVEAGLDTIEAKVLTLNGFAPFDDAKCRVSAQTLMMTDFYCIISDTCLYRWGHFPRRASCLTNKTNKVRKIKLLRRH